MNKLPLVYTAIALLGAGVTPAKAYDVTQSRADFLHFTNELRLMADRQGHPLSAKECDVNGCSKDVVFQPQPGDAEQWVSVSYIWGNGPDKGPDHFVALVCAGQASDYPYRMCYNSDGAIFRQKLVNGEFHLESFVRRPVPAWVAEAKSPGAGECKGCGE
jgi:hypothetical protein